MLLTQCQASLMTWAHAGVFYKAFQRLKRSAVPTQASLDLHAIIDRLHGLVTHATALLALPWTHISDSALMAA